MDERLLGGLRGIGMITAGSAGHQELLMGGRIIPWMVQVDAVCPFMLFSCDGCSCLLQSGRCGT